MNYALPKPPAVIASIKRVQDEYSLLKKRRSTLMWEIEDNSERSKMLKALRVNELQGLNMHLEKIEHFLRRYGFIDSKRTT